MIVAGIAVAGCGSGSVDDVGAAVGNLAFNVEATTTTTAPPTTTTTTAVPVDPWLNRVATLRPGITVLETFDAPAGERVDFEFLLTNPTYWDTPLHLLILETSLDGRWLQVALPVRPNGSTAWIRARDVTIDEHRFRAEVNVTTRTVRVWEGDTLVAETGAVVGKPSSPTPLGSFYINDILPQANPSGAYGPYILSTSAFSEALATFDGGLPVIGIHGTNRPELIGQDRSNGCVRIPNEVIAVLAETVPVGTPVEVVA